jgi:hypothetical protein
MRPIVMKGVGSHLRRMVGMGEYAVGGGRVAVREFKPDAVSLLEDV